MPCDVAIRILKQEKDVAMDWCFIEITQLTLTYRELVEKILDGDYPCCELKNSIFPCKNLSVLYGLSSKDGTNKEKVKGGPETDIIQIGNKFSMLYFSLICEHKKDCSDCKPPAQMKPPSALDFIMQTAKNQASSNRPSPFENPSNGKERLWNDLLNGVKKTCELPKSSSNGAICKTFFTRLRDTLWYIDGHHTTIQRESNRKVPDFFAKFKGYNMPQKSKHKKRTFENLSEKKLSELALSINDIIQCMKFIDDSQPWRDLRLITLKLSQVIDDYANYLRAKCAAVKRIQLTPRNEVEKQCNVTVLPIMKNSQSLYYELVQADLKLQQAECYLPISLRENLRPGLNRHRFHQIVDGYILKKGFATKTVHYVHHIGGPKPSLHFVWKIPEHESETNLISRNMKVITDIQKEVPIYERRITKREFKNAFGFAAPSHTLRAMFKEISGDKSKPTNLTEAEIDRRLEFCLLSGDESIIVDLRNLPQDKKDSKYEIFFDETVKYLQQDVGVACHDRRHHEELYIAKAISFQDLHKRVKERLPAGTPTPSVKWLRYQFQPIHPNANTAKYYKARIKIKMMVQKRQIRVKHVDAHYCAAMWKYMREYAVRTRDITTLVSLDDKHKIKCGEPSYPVAAAERGKKVIVGENQVMAALDHDFTKFGIIPSVDLLIDVPETMDGSFYRGQVNVGFKDSILQASSPLRHSAELIEVLKSKPQKPVLMLYSDGGPDHRLTYNSVKLALITIFIKLDLDMLIAIRTAPNNSWANPVERIMSIVNIGLQGVGVMRTKMGEKFEKAVGKAKSVKEIRTALKAKEEDREELERELAGSLEMPISLLKDQMKRLSLKTKPFEVFDPASNEQIDDLWETCLTIDKNLNRDDLTKKGTKALTDYNEFLKTHCKVTHYSFQVKKCHSVDCNICRPYREEKSKQLPFLPDPEFDDKQEHYKSFDTMYGKTTTDNRPSLKARPASDRKKIGFSPSKQHAENTDTMLQCEDCDKWRLVFAKKKLTKAKKEKLREFLEDVSYTCGFMFDDVDLPDGISVFVRDHDCADLVEKLYYSCNYQPICIYCGFYLSNADEDADTYPQCVDCDGEEVKKREPRTEKRT